MWPEALLFVHLAGVVVWVGGMFFAYFCLRPAAAQRLQPPDRLSLWAATFAVFFRLVTVAVVAILATGGAMFLRVGSARAPAGWHLMAACGLAMTVVFAYVYGALFPRLRAACAASAWPDAATALDAIRRLVALNLALSVVAIAAAAAARG